jgi:hypothetical protein
MRLGGIESYLGVTTNLWFSFSQDDQAGESCLMADQEAAVAVTTAMTGIGAAFYGRCSQPRREIDRGVARYQQEQMDGWDVRVVKTIIPVPSYASLNISVVVHGS